MIIKNSIKLVTTILIAGLLGTGCNNAKTLDSEVVTDVSSDDTSQMQLADDTVVDLGYIDLDKLTGDIAELYQVAIRYELDNPPYEDYETDINYGVGDIDGDDIPELFMIRGDSHIDTVTIYSYDSENNEAVYIGDFGGFGSCNCVLGENKIISSYGNGGYYFTCVTEIGPGKQPVLVDVILNNGSQEEIKSYYGFSLEDFSGAMPRGDYDINRFENIDEEYLISQEEAAAINERIYENSICIDANYCSNIAERRIMEN